MEADLCLGLNRYEWPISEKSRRATVTTRPLHRACSTENPPRRIAAGCGKPASFGQLWMMFAMCGTPAMVIFVPSLRVMTALPPTVAWLIWFAV